MQQQQQICPRCKFRLTMVKSICPTCGYALQMTRKPEAAAPSAPKPVHQTAPVVNRSASTNNANTARKAQAAQSNGGGSFWRAFLGLDPLPTESSERDDHAYGET